MIRKRQIALITGVTGQDGSYLAQLLLERGYDVYGLAHGTSLSNRPRVDAIRHTAEKLGRAFVVNFGDLCDPTSVRRIIASVRPTELYNLASQSHVGVSFDQPEYSAEINALGVLRLLDAIVSEKLSTRFYQAASSELFGSVEQSPQNEQTPFHPCSPYAIAKLYAYWTVNHYRKAYNVHASNGILYNHESPRRGETFVTRKITLAIARMAEGSPETLKLGYLDARRDWGFAGDYVRAMWAMLQQEIPEDYVIATGVAHSVREFVERAAEVAGFDVVWEGEGVDEVGVDRVSNRVLVEIDPRFYRKVEVGDLVGDAAKAQSRLLWSPTVHFDELVEMMMVSDMALAANENAKATTHH